jgi:hypothetical protein
MDEERLCDACSKLLSGDRDPSIRLQDKVVHHADADSFRQALRLRCYLCCFAWAKPFESTLREDNLPDSTGYYFSRNYFDIDHESLEVDGLNFPLYPEGTYPLKIVPWESS